jgi:hypothetical protein
MRDAYGHSKMDHHVCRAPITPGGQETDDEVWKPEAKEDLSGWGRAMESANKQWESPSQVKAGDVQRRETSEWVASMFFACKNVLYNK